MKSITVPRSNVFTLEDGTCVVQRGIDRVQELINGNTRRFSSMDTGYEITDPELDILKAQGIISQYDNFFVWLGEELANFNFNEDTFGTLTLYSVTTDLPIDALPEIDNYLHSAGLADRYIAVERFGQIVVLGAHEEPFLRLSSAENAQTLLLPFMQTLQATMSIDVFQFQANTLPVHAPHEVDLLADSSTGLIRRLLPNTTVKTVVCIDDDPETHEIFAQVCAELGIDLVSATDGKQGLTWIQDADPALVVLDLSLPDIHGYEVVAATRNDPDLSHIPIMVITHLDTATDRALAYTVAGVIDYIVKPINTTNIRRRVWRELNQRK